MKPNPQPFPYQGRGECESASLQRGERFLYGLIRVKIAVNQYYKASLAAAVRITQQLD